ncbi:hypothetical protein PMI14_04590 [Acidovorax sp. CF316]|uniref:gamma-glutamylcyclotransferase family protein n=1 Tax=Acidovorax sp. CF316 TaxID=1144317 RepID=UPI00026BC7B2|nr:gamma-glutamylcyclotransferase family protein [Acidovorax sp. CF316]EJE50805.1 hypothetical protein PMI14_04590 [Acidovorax sp. CF316]
MPDASPSSGPLRCVFVYGTLRKGGSNDITRLQPAPRFIGFSRIAGTLYHLGAYPGLVLGGTVDVVGEVYAMEPALERRLDAIEEISGAPDDEYFKREIALEVGGRSVDCLVYEINPSRVRSAARIDGGDWMRDVARAPRA